MAIEKLIGGQSIDTTDAIAGTARMLGWNWKTNATGKAIVGGAVRMHSDGFFASGTKFITWTRASPISSSTVLFNIDISSLTGTGGTWVDVPGISETAITQNQQYLSAIYHPSTQGGNYFYKGSGGWTAPGGSLTINCIFKNGGSNSQPPDDETFTGGAFAVDIYINDASTGVSGTINEVTETGTVFPISRAKSRVIGFVTESGSVFPISRLKSRVVNQVTESGLILPVHGIHSRTINQIVETGTVNPISAKKSKEIAQVTEVGTVQAVHSNSAISREIGQVIELSAVGRLGVKPDPDTIIVIPSNKTIIKL